MDLSDQRQVSAIHWGVRQTGILRGFSEDNWVLVAQLLILLNLVAMTRAFALVSLIEFILWCLFVFYSPLRRAFLQACSDIRVKLVFVFWGWIAIATLWSSADYFLRLEEVWSWRKLTLFPMAWVLFGVPRSKLVAIFTLVSIASLYMLASWAGHFGYISLDRPPSELLENHSTQGVVFASASLLILIMLRTVKFPIWAEIVCYLLVSGMVLNIIYVLTGRTAYISLLLLAPFGAWIVASRHKFLSAAVVLIVISLALFNSETAKVRVSQGLSEFDATITGEATSYSSMGIRWVYWENTLSMIAMKPFFGSGSGGFSSDYADFVKNHEGWRARVTDDPHQQYLLIAGEQGLIGLFLFLALLTAMLITRGDDRNRLCAIGILMMTAVNGMFNGHFGSFVEGRLFWIMSGILLCSTMPMKTAKDVVEAITELGRLVPRFLLITGKRNVN